MAVLRPGAARGRLVVVGLDVVVCLIAVVLVARGGGHGRAVATGGTPGGSSVSGAVSGVPGGVTSGATGGVAGGAAPGGSGSAAAAGSAGGSAGAAGAVQVPRWPAGTALVTDIDGGLIAVDPHTLQPRRVTLPDGYAVLAVPGPGTPYAGAVLVAEQAQGTVSWLTPTGLLGAEITVGGAPTGAVFGADGTMLVLDAGGDAAVPVAPDGTVGTPVKVGSNPIAALATPTGFAVLSEGNGRAEHGVVSVIDLRRPVPSYDVDVGVSPVALAAGGATGTFYVADAGAGPITVVTGKSVAELTGATAPTALVAAGRDVLVADGHHLRRISDGRMTDLAATDDDIADLLVTGSHMFFDLADDPGLFLVGADARVTRVAGVDFRVGALAAGGTRVFAGDLAGRSLTVLDPAGSVSATVSLPAAPLRVQVVAS